MWDRVGGTRGRYGRGATIKDGDRSVPATTEGYDARRARHILLPLLLTLACCIPSSLLRSSTSHAAARPRDPYTLADRFLARMTLQQKIGQMVIAPVDSVVATGRLGGVLVFGSDIVSPSQGRARLAALARAEGVPLLVAVDEEGGAISTMSSGGVPGELSPAQYGALGSPARVYQDALKTGRALRALGVNMDLAPVLDVLTNPRSPIGSRSYGADPARVATLGAAAIRGYQGAGLAATAKHFLGLGVSGADAHRELPTDAHTLSQLERGELVPMLAAIKAGVDALMVTHVAIPAIDASGTPASLSRPIVTGFIRGRLGYQGLIITDSLAMGGLGAHIASIQAAAVRAVEAGNDMVLIAADVPTIKITLTALDHAAFAGQLPVSAIDASVRRILIVKARLGLLGR